MQVQPLWCGISTTTGNGIRKPRYIIDRGQPQETYNIIKRFSRLIIGYFTASITQIKVNAKNSEDRILASVASDVIQNILEDNNFYLFAGDIILNAIISGLFISESKVKIDRAED